MKRTKYPIHPDFKKWENRNPPLNKFSLFFIQKALGTLIYKEKSTDTLIVDNKEIPVADGAFIQALLYTPKSISTKAPCLVYYHGGGFVIPAAPFHYSLAKEYALGAHCKLLFVHYRLAPKHPFPIAPHDCYAAYKWVIDNALHLGIDPDCLAVGGDSAGGTLAAVVCLMARENKQVMPCAQMLIYPALGIGIETESMRKYTDTPMCNSKDAKKYDQLYAPDPSAGKTEYLSPLKASSFEGLPSAYIENAEFDCLRDGGIMYAEQLRKSGVSAYLHNTKGTIHGFDVVLDSSIVRDCVSRRIAFLNQSWHGK